MGCRIITGTMDADVEAAVFYCSTTMTAFGPVMNSLEEAEKFLQVSFPGNADPRNCNPRELADKYSDFVTKWVCECGTIRDDSCEGCKDGWDKNSRGEHMIECASNCGTYYEVSPREWTELEPCTAEPEPPKGQRFICSACQSENQKSA